ncbi:MAG: hypothetical protein V4501_02155 [Pseudomonadota bacterium]
MRVRKLSDVRTDILLLIGQATLIVCCIAFIIFDYNVNIAPDKRVAEEFAVTSCVVTDKSMAIVGRVVHRYRADFRVTYATEMGSKSSVASANGMDFSYTTNQAAQQEYLDEFDIGGDYPCWYDPEKTSTVVLVLRHNWYSTLPLILPTLVALIMLVYMVRALMDLFEIYRTYKKRG